MAAKWEENVEEIATPSQKIMKWHVKLDGCYRSAEPPAVVNTHSVMAEEGQSLASLVASVVFAPQAALVWAELPSRFHSRGE